MAAPWTTLLSGLLPVLTLLACSLLPGSLVLSCPQDTVFFLPQDDWPMVGGESPWPPPRVAQFGCRWRAVGRARLPERADPPDVQPVPAPGAQDIMVRGSGSGQWQPEKQ